MDTLVVSEKGEKWQEAGIKVATDCPTSLKLDPITKSVLADLVISIICQKTKMHNA